MNEKNAQVIVDVLIPLAILSELMFIVRRSSKAKMTTMKPVLGMCTMYGRLEV